MALHVACRAAKARGALYKLSDGGGLQLWVQPNGAKLWSFAFRFGDRQKLLAIGAYPVISLADARQVRDDAKRTLAFGGDPSQVKRAAGAAQARARPPSAPSPANMSPNSSGKGGLIRPFRKSNGCGSHMPPIAKHVAVAQSWSLS